VLSQTAEGLLGGLLGIWLARRSRRDLPRNWQTDHVTATADHSHVPRGGDGAWRRSLPAVQRDAEAARLHAQNWSYERIAQALGYTDRKDAWRAVQQVLTEAAQTTGTQEARLKQLAKIQELERQAWERLADPQPVVDRQGNIVYRPDGSEVPDAATWAAVAQVVLRCLERSARLTGLDAPKRSVSVIADIPLSEVETYVAQLRAELGLAEAGAEAPPGRVLPGLAEPA
jgi:hypothetical protein